VRTDLTMPPDSWLRDEAKYLQEQLRASGFPAKGALTRQALALGEEVGEFIGASRRYSGNARRIGTAAAMYLELADVTITAYVTAAELNINLDHWCARKLQDIYTRGWREETPR
jgi:NTP pyrophosphatase (non-canonical NTP hydrolase)